MAGCVVLHSGGLDSTVCLLKALELGRTVVSVGINYGQTHQVELEFAARQCERLGVIRRVLHVEWSKPGRTIPYDRTIEQMRSQISTAFLPGRNVVFLSLGCAEAAGLGFDEVWLGINEIDFSGYPDCSQRFLEAYQKMMEVAVPSGPSVIAPLIHMSKPQIALEAKRLGIQPADTWSCYRPVVESGHPAPCGRCDACLLHVHAWQGATNLGKGNALSASDPVRRGTGTS